jgi:hypothetical protein
MSNQDQQHPEGSPSGAESVALLPGAPLCYVPYPGAVADCVSEWSEACYGCPFVGSPF